VGDYIYWGILCDYFVASNGMLDSVVLAVPKRRKLGDGEDADQPESACGPPPAYDIHAYFLILKYSECKNIGILTVQIDEELATPDPGAIPDDERGEPENAPSPV
jgi:hypothetical protein